MFLGVLSRSVAAVLGGYVLANTLSIALAAVIASVWPMERSDTVLLAMLPSFVIYAGAVMWAFAVRSALRAWAGLAALALPSTLLAWVVLR